MSWDPSYCEPNGCQATHIPCPKAADAHYAGSETTHHLAPKGGVMKCIYCHRSQKEIEAESKAAAS